MQLTDWKGHGCYRFGLSRVTWMMIFSYKENLTFFHYLSILVVVLRVAGFDRWVSALFNIYTIPDKGHDFKTLEPNSHARQ